MDFVSKISEYSRKFLEDYTSVEEINADLEAVNNENFVLVQIIEVFERYLRKKSPTTLFLNIGIDKQAGDVSTRGSVTISRLSPSLSKDSGPSPELHRTSTSTTSSPALTSRSAFHSSLANYKINLIYRLEMVERELEEGKMTLEKMKRRFESARFLLETEEENIKMDLEALKLNKLSLQNFVIENSDKKTGRVFVDKYLRFLETELQNKDRELRKMKLKTRTYQTEYSRLKSQQQQKLELREHLHPVDLERLHIDNEKHLKILEEKTKQLLNLKKVVGKKGQNMVSMKSKLNDTNIFLKNIKQDIKVKQSKYITTGIKETQNMNDLLAAEVQNQSIKKLNTTFKSPDVHSYLKMELTICELQSEKDMWERRCKYQKQNITLLEHQMKQLAYGRKSHMVPRSSRSRSKSTFGSRSVDSLRKSVRRITHCTPTALF